MTSANFTSLLVIFGLVIVMGMALIAESIITHLIRRGWNPKRSFHKMKFVFFSILESFVVRWRRLLKREPK